MKRVTRISTILAIASAGATAQAEVTGNIGWMSDYIFRGIPLANSSAMLGWMFSEWLLHGKPSVLGIASGAVAGLVAITPASGSVGPMGAIVIGAAAGVASYFAATKLKNLLGYDDSLDVFGVHAVGGIIGALLTGVFSAATFGGAGIDGSIGNQVKLQAIGIVVTIAYTGAVSWIILRTVGALIGLRVSEEDESEGLDIALHQESGYNL